MDNGRARLPRHSEIKLVRVSLRVVSNQGALTAIVLNAKLGVGLVYDFEYGIFTLDSESFES